MKPGEKSIRVVLTPEEHAFITMKAKEQKVSVQCFGKTKLLDETKGVNELKDTIVRLLPAFYNLVKQVDDSTLKKDLNNWGNLLWQC